MKPYPVLAADEVAQVTLNREAGQGGEQFLADTYGGRASFETSSG
jgi:hypothetical protein